MSSPMSESSLRQFQDYLTRVQALLRADRMAEAAKLSADAIAAGLEHPNLLTLAAYHHLNANDDQRAFAHASRARELAPGNVDVLNAVGSCLAKLGRYQDAVAIYDEALLYSPNAFMIHFSRGMALEQSGQVAHAREAYERTLAIRPQHAVAAARIAYLAAQRGDGATARKHARKALAIDSQQSLASVALALADVNDFQFERAVEAAQSVVERPKTQPLTRTIALGILGDALDGLDRRDDAFKAYRDAGELLAATHKQKSGESALDRVRRLTAFMRQSPVDLWTSDGAQSPVQTHVFLVGFPRSGTTLLEQVLAASPSIEALDEHDTLTESYPFTAKDDALAEFATKPSAELEEFRTAYWKRVTDAGISLSRPVFVDKMPLNTVVLCLIAKLFPSAKILFALRDPRDVVFSCFRRRFGMTRQMYELLTPESAATYYDAVMSLADVYRAKLTLPFLDTRYEDLVLNFEGETRRLCDFLGITYDDAMKQFASNEQLAEIDTPSVAQVSRGLYTQGMGQWRRYREQLAPVLPKLEPWVARFGYAEN